MKLILTHESEARDRLGTCTPAEITHLNLIPGDVIRVKRSNPILDAEHTYGCQLPQYILRAARDINNHGMRVTAIKFIYDHLQHCVGKAEGQLKAAQDIVETMRDDPDLIYNHR